jgi:hypothetical protein
MKFVFLLYELNNAILTERFKIPLKLCSGFIPAGLLLSFPIEFIEHIRTFEFFIFLEDIGDISESNLKIVSLSFSK